MIPASRSIVVKLSVGTGLILSGLAAAAPPARGGGDRVGRREAKGDAEARRVLMERRQADWQAGLLQAHPELDSDKDGRLSPAEMKAGRAVIEEFRRTQAGKQILAQHPEADMNGDGQLSQEEMKAFRQSRVGPAAGRPGPGQMIDWLLNHFDRADADGNGQLSKDELLKLKEQIGERGAGPTRPGAAEPKDETKAVETDQANVLAGPDHPKGEKKAKRTDKQQRKAAKRGAAEPASE